MFKEAAIVG